MTQAGFVAAAVAGVIWLAAAGLLAWRRGRPPALAGWLVLAGSAPALAGWLAAVAGAWPTWAPEPAVNASGIALAAVLIHAALAGWRREDTVTRWVVAGAVVLQAAALGATFRIVPPAGHAAVLPALAAARDVAALLGGGGLVVSLCAAGAGLYLAHRRHGESAPADHAAQMEDAGLRLALPSLAVALLCAAGRSWYGYGEIAGAGVIGLTIAWLLVTAAFSAAATGAASTRLTRALTALAFVAALAGAVGLA